MSDFDFIRQRISRAYGQFLSQVPWLARAWGSSFDALNFDDVPFVPLRKPLRQCRLALITT
nr:hypothetical protein [Chloroflexaceae bacterium]